MTSPLVATPADNPGVEVCSAPGGGQGDCSKTSPYKNNRIRPSSAARSSTPVTLNTSGLNVCPFPLLRHVRVGARLDLEPRGRVGGGGADGRRDHQEAGDAHGGVADVALELLQVAGRQLVDALLALVVPHEDVAAAADPEAAVAVVGAVHGPVGEEDLAVAAGQLDQVAVVQLARRRRGGDIAEDHAVEVVGSPASSRMAPSWAPVSVSSSLSHPTRVISIPSVSFTPATIERDLEHGLEHVRRLGIRVLQRVRGIGLPEQLFLERTLLHVPDDELARPLLVRLRYVLGEAVDDPVEVRLRHSWSSRSAPSGGIPALVAADFASCFAPVDSSNRISSARRTAFTMGRR